MARIAVDAMGGDLAPRAPIAGALQALGALPPQHHIELVGQTSVIEAELDALLRGDFAPLAHVRDRISIIEAPEGSVDVPALKAFLKERLAAYQVPVDYRFIDAFPRTTTMKIARPELKAMLGLG